MLHTKVLAARKAGEPWGIVSRFSYVDPDVEPLAIVALALSAERWRVQGFMFEYEFEVMDEEDIARQTSLMRRRMYS